MRVLHGFSACLAGLALVLAFPGAAGSQERNQDEWTDVLSINHGAAGETTTGRVRIAAATGAARAPARLALDVAPGPLQQVLARAHREGSVVEKVEVRGWDAAGKPSGAKYLKYKLERVYIVSYQSGAAGSARVVLEPAPPAAGPRAPEASVDDIRDAPRRRSIRRHVRLLGYETRVEIPRPGRAPYALRVEVPRQAISGGKIRIILKDLNGAEPPVSTLGRVLSDSEDPPRGLAAPSGGREGEVAMEELTVAVERIEYDRRGRLLVGRLAPTAGREGDPGVGTEFEVPLPDFVMKEIAGGG
jgi:hypothetical protein